MRLQFRGGLFECGAIIRQGPHQGAQKSTSTGMVVAIDMFVEVTAVQFDRMGGE